MSKLILTNDTLTDPADKTEVEANFADVKTVINGNLSTDNISELSVDKLTGQYYYVYLTFGPVLLSSADDYSVNFDITDVGPYSLNALSYKAENKGDSAGTLVVQEGSWNGLGTFTVTASSDIKTVTGSGTAIGFNTLTTSVTSDKTYRVLTTAAGSSPGPVWVTLSLKRKIHT